MEYVYSFGMTITLEIPAEMETFRLPSGVQARLTDLLRRQDSGETLTPEEGNEAEGLVELSETLSLLKLRTTSA